MSESCPVLTPEEQRLVDIIGRAERGMMATILEAIEDAQDRAARELAGVGFKESPPARDYFMAVAHQKLFLRLCGADPDTMEGGNPEIATAIINNSRNISKHYWVGKTDPESRQLKPE